MAGHQKLCMGRASSRVGSVFSLLAVAGFVGLSLYSKWNPVQGEETPPFKKLAAGEAQKANPKAAKGKKKEPELVKSSVQGPVPAKGKKLDHRELARVIDAEVAKRLATEGITPSSLADDAEFLRRVTLDLIGVIPGADRV